MRGLRRMRKLKLAVIIQSALLIGFVGGVMSWSANHTMPDAMMTGASTFAAAVAILLAFHRFLVGGPGKD